jgi:predicted secreted protein
MAKVWGHGTTFSVGGVAVGGLTSITIPEQEKGIVDVTDHDSGGDMEFLPGLRDGGTVQLEGRHISTDAGQDRVRHNYNEDDETLACVLTLRNGTTYTFTAFTTNPGGGEAPYDNNPVSWSAAMKITGNPVKSPLTTPPS